MKRLTLGFIAALCALAVSTGASAGTISFSFPNFSSTAGLTLNGNAAVVGGTDLRLAPATTNQGGSAFTDSPVNAETFSTQFEFRISNAGGISDGTDTGADGITFTLHNDAAGAGALGGLGGSLGYAGISPSVSVEFDTWNNGPGLSDGNSNHISVNTNGSLAAALATTPIAPRFDNGGIWDAWIDYDGMTLDVFVDPTNSGIKGAAVLSTVIDIKSLIGSTAHVGFTAATGAAFGDHDILSWSYTGSVPESGTLALLGLGLVFLGARTRRRTG